MFPDDKQYEYQNSIMPALFYKSADAVLKEQDHMRSIKIQASKIKSFGSITLVVLTATDEKRYDLFVKDEKLKKEMLTAWNKMQNDFLLLSTNSRQIFVPNSGHYMNQEQPKVIENDINEMVDNISKQK